MSTLPKKHKKWLYLYAKGPCDKCVCTVCESKCDRNRSPCERCEKPGARMLRKPLLACIETGKLVLGEAKIIRGIIQDDWQARKTMSPPKEAIKVIRSLFEEE